MIRDAVLVTGMLPHLNKEIRLTEDVHSVLLSMKAVHVKLNLRLNYNANFSLRLVGKVT